MSKHTVTHSCGHTHEYQLYGKSDERTRKIKWLETQECPDCQKAAEAAEAAKINEELNLPVLSGSEKQVAWANNIRASFISAAQSMNFKMDYVLELIKTETKASVFIDERNSDVKSFLYLLHYNQTKKSN